MTQVKMFQDAYEDKMNKWLREHKDVKIIDIKLASAGTFTPYAIIIYEV